MTSFRQWFSRQSREARQRIREAQSTGAQRLDLSNLELTRLPAEIGQLTNLQELNVENNQLTILPTEVCQLTNLRELDLAHNQLTTLPTEVCQLTNLHTLRLAHNQLTTLPTAIGRLTNLHTLRLRGNRLVELPRLMDRLTNLEALHLRDNWLTELPAQMGQLTNLHTLRLEGNPLAEPLPELVSQGTPAVLAYLRSLRDAEAQFEAKLLLLGDPEAGKSSVVARLRGEGFDRDRSSTHGIELDGLHLPHPDPEQQAMITLHTWDFGGQRLYQATHQLFLTPQALYLLVLNPRQGTGEQVDRWLRRIHLLVGDQARVVLVTTHADDSHRPDLDFAALQQAYPTLLAEMVEVDNDSGYGIDLLSKVIAKQAARLPQMGEEVSRRWTATRDELLARPEPQLDRAACVAVCAEHALDAAEADALVGLLHVRGQVLWYADDPGLRELVVLQPEWLAKAISYVLEDQATADAGGVLDHARLREIWQGRTDAPAYPAEFHPFLLQLMERFDVSYRLDPPGASLVGYLVPDARPPLPWSLTEPPAPGKRSLSVRCRLADEATGLIAWLTVRNSRFSTGRHWKRGAFLALPGEFASEALLELVDHRELAVTVHAPAPEHFFHVLLDSVRELIRQRWPGLHYELQVPCAHRSDGHPCPGRFSLRALQLVRTKGVTELPCTTCGAAHDVSRLLTGYPGTVRVGPASTAELQARFDDYEERLDRIQHTGQQTLLTTQTLLEVTSDIAGLTRVVLKLWTSQYETLDGCPRLYTLTPVAADGVHKAAVWQQRFFLQLWCEYDQQPHPSDASYEFARDKDWWVRIGPHAQMVTRILRHILNVAAPVLTLGLPVGDLKESKDKLEAMDQLLDQLPAELPAELADPDYTDDPAVAEGAGLRALRALLGDLDPNRIFGGLLVARTAANDLLWICPDHYQRYVQPRPVLPASEHASPPG
jgi:internalin A